MSDSGDPTLVFDISWDTDNDGKGDLRRIVSYDVDGKKSDKAFDGNLDGAFDYVMKEFSDMEGYRDLKLKPKKIDDRQWAEDDTKIEKDKEERSKKSKKSKKNSAPETKDLGEKKRQFEKKAYGIVTLTVEFYNPDTGMFIDVYEFIPFGSTQKVLYVDVGGDQQDIKLQEYMSLDAAIKALKNKGYEPTKHRRF